MGKAANYSSTVFSPPKHWDPDGAWRRVCKKAMYIASQKDRTTRPQANKLMICLVTIEEKNRLFNTDECTPQQNRKEDALLKNVTRLHNLFLPIYSNIQNGNIVPDCNWEYFEDFLKVNEPRSGGAFIPEWEAKDFEYFIDDGMGNLYNTK